MRRHTCISLLLSVLLWLSGATTALADDVERLLDAFNQSPSAANANAFLRTLHERQFFDEPIRFTTADPADTLRQQVWYWAAEWYYDRQQYATAASYAKQALPLLHIPSEQADCMSLVSLCHFRQGDYDAAARYAKQVYQTDVRTGDADRQSSSLNTLAGIYMAARQPRQAEQYILKGLALAREVDNPARHAVLLGKASEVSHQLGDDEKALSYAQQAYDVERTLGHEDRLAIRLSQMASAYIGLGRYDAARDTLDRAIPLLETTANRQQLGICCNQMGLLLLKECRDADAATYFERARSMFRQLGDRYNECISLDGLAKALRDTDPAAALSHMERRDALKDSIYDRETGELLSQYAAQYGYEQLQEESARDRRHTLLAAAAVVLVLLLLAAAAVCWMRRRTRRHSKALQQRLDRLQTSIGRLSSGDDGAGETLSAADSQFLTQTMAVVNQQIDSGTVSVDSVAAALGMSVSAFRRRLSALTGETPKNYIQAIRMQKARHLLDTQRNLSIAEVALRCGYDEATNFTRSFRRHYGMTPTDYLAGDGQENRTLQEND